MARKHWMVFALTATIVGGCVDDSESSSDAAAMGHNATKQIFFGDMHVHTTASFDAAAIQILHGIKNDIDAACDYARICSQLDFWGSSEHAEGMWISPVETIGDKWKKVTESVKACNALGNAVQDANGNAEFVVFQGFEWTSSGQADTVPDRWGHKNVFFANDAVPPRPVASWSLVDIPNLALKYIGDFIDELTRLDPDYANEYLEDTVFGLSSYPVCPPGAEPDGTCNLVAYEPRELWSMLNGWREEFADQGYDVLAIPHGTAWGVQAVDADWPIQLTEEQIGSDIQILAEIYSGHGNSEEWRDLSNPVRHFSDPQTVESYFMCSDAAAAITLRECQRLGGTVTDCTKEAETARDTGLVDYDKGYYASREDWGLCNQCTDCFQPAERYTPTGAIQTALALRGFEGDTPERRFIWGFIGSTDTHNGAPGDVKEVKFQADIPNRTSVFRDDPVTNPIFNPLTLGRDRVEGERLASYLYPGGLAAVHAKSLSREDLWAAFKRREVYATSGPRISLWFNVSVGNHTVPMGGQLESTTDHPVLRVEAWGAPIDAPGCSESTADRFGSEILTSLCHGDCYNPQDERVGIDRIEIVRITPQVRPDESIGELIEDPWKVIENPNRDADGNPSPTMSVTVTDDTFVAGGRDALYYVRAIQVPTLAVNGSPMKDPDGNWHACTSDPDDQCLGWNEERAWSSPVYIDYR